MALSIVHSVFISCHHKAVYFIRKIKLSMQLGYLWASRQNISTSITMMAYMAIDFFSYDDTRFISLFFFNNFKVYCKKNYSFLKKCILTYKLINLEQGVPKKYMMLFFLIHCDKVPLKRQHSHVVRK